MTLRCGWLCPIVLGAALMSGCHCPSGPSDNGGDGSAASSHVSRADAGSGDPEPPQPPLPAWGGDVPAIAAALVDAELARDADAPALGDAMLVAAERPAAVWSVARIESPGVARQLLPLIDGDAKPTAAELAAVSFLEPPRGEPAEGSVWFELEDALWTRYAVTEDLDAAQALLLAIARVGGVRSQALLAVDVADPAYEVDSDERSRQVAALEAIGMLCARGHRLGPTALEALEAALAADVERAGAAAYATSRCAGPSAEQLAGSARGEIVERLVPLLAAPDANAAKLAYKALGSLGEVPPEVPQAVLGTRGLPWLVEVEAVRALASHADGRRTLATRLAQFPVAAIAGTRTHVVIEALRGLRVAVNGSPELIGQLVEFKASVADASTEQGDVRRKKALALVGCELAFLDAAVSGNSDALVGCALSIEGMPPTYGRVLAVDALLAAGPVLSSEQKASALLALASDLSPAVAQAAVSALADVDHAGVSGVLRQALVRDDVGVKAAAATAIATRAVDRSRRDPDAVLTLIDVLGTVDNATGVEARLSAIAALGHLAPAAPSDRAAGTADEPPDWLAQALLPLGRDSSSAIRRAVSHALSDYPELRLRTESQPVALEPFDPRVASALQASRTATPLRLRIVSDAGPFVIDFQGAPAPLAQAVLASLAEAGFFDGLAFHRVVPGFVVQGGDPRGDGYGGPGFLVPCERSSLRYERGTVGIALAGKDTGGSQFFIAHGREPRLDARYTIVGQVVEGMEVVDEILPFDRMIEVKVERSE